MPKTLSRLDQIDASLQVAWHNLCVARTIASRSPNAQTLAAEEEAEQLLNLWLERRHEHTN